MVRHIHNLWTIWYFIDHNISGKTYCYGSMEGEKRCLWHKRDKIFRRILPLWLLSMQTRIWAVENSQRTMCILNKIRYERPDFNRFSQKTVYVPWTGHHWATRPDNNWKLWEITTKCERTKNNQRRQIIPISLKRIRLRKTETLATNKQLTWHENLQKEELYEQLWTIMKFCQINESKRHSCGFWPILVAVSR